MSICFQRNEIKRQITLFLLLALVFLGPGCCSKKTYFLDDDYYPLKRIKERPKLPFVGNGIVYVVGRTVYVKNLDRWLRDNPPGTNMFNDCLAHERIHSRRQLRYGLAKWLFRYFTDKEFRLYEEQLGYYTSIKRKMARGVNISMENYAANMSSSYFGMITYDDALKWVNEVVKGNWKPLDGDEDDG